MLASACRQHHGMVGQIAIGLAQGMEGGDTILSGVVTIAINDQQVVGFHRQADDGLRLSSPPCANCFFIGACIRWPACDGRSLIDSAREHGEAALSVSKSHVQVAVRMAVTAPASDEMIMPGHSLKSP